MGSRQAFEGWSTHSFDEVDQTVREAHAAFTAWWTSDWPRRAALLDAVADELTTRREQLGALVTDEMGKPVREALAEIDKCAWTARFYPGHAEGFLADRAVTSPAARSWVGYEGRCALRPVPSLGQRPVVPNERPSGTVRADGGHRDQNRYRFVHRPAAGTTKRLQVDRVGGPADMARGDQWVTAATLPTP